MDTHAFRNHAREAQPRSGKDPQPLVDTGVEIGEVLHLLMRRHGVIVNTYMLIEFLLEARLNSRISRDKIDDSSYRTCEH